MLEFFPFLPLLSFLFVFGLGAFVLYKFFLQRKETLLVLFLFCMSIAIWLFGTFIMFLNKNSENAIFWDKFVYIGVVFIPALMYHFALTFTENKKRKFSLVVAYIISTFFLALIPTKFLVDGLFVYKWGVHTKAQPLHDLFMIYLVIIIFSFLFMVYDYYKKTKIDRYKNQAIFIFIAFFLLMFTGIFAFLPAYQIPVWPFPFASGFLFIVVLSYATLKYKLLDLLTAKAFLFTYINDITYNLSSGLSVVNDQEVYEAIKNFNKPNLLENSSLLRLGLVKVFLHKDKAKTPVDALKLLLKEAIEDLKPDNYSDRRLKQNLKHHLLTMLAFEDAEEGQILWELGFDEYPVRIMSRENNLRSPIFQVKSPSDFTYTSRNAYLALKKEAIHDVTWRISYLEKLSKR